jgi:hypothetical protein
LKIMVEILVAATQTAAVMFLAWGAFLCLFSGAERKVEAAARGRATDFEIGFRRLRLAA